MPRPLVRTPRPPISGPVTTRPSAGVFRAAFLRRPVQFQQQALTSQFDPSSGLSRAAFSATQSSEAKTGPAGTSRAEASSTQREDKKKGKNGMTRAQANAAPRGR